MQTPGKLNLNCYQGATFDYELTWTAAGSAVDLTDYTARMQVRPSYDSTQVIVSLASGSGITLGGTAGTIELFLSAEDTAELDGTPSTQFLYDLELESSSGNVTRLVEGSFFIYPEVTR
jgi:hypothetical protein